MVVADDQPPSEQAPAVRYEVTVHTAEPGIRSLDAVADLDLDRVPDPEGGVRVLVSVEEAQDLVRRGYEVHITRAVPVRPLDPALVPDDDAVRAWFEERIRGAARPASGEPEGRG